MAAAMPITFLDLPQIEPANKPWNPEPDRNEALTLGALLTQPGRTYDVSSPDLPTVK